MPARESMPGRILRIEGLPITAVLLVLVALFMLVAPEVFLSYRIYMSFLANVPPLLVLAAGLTLLIAAGEIDLSFPSVVALSGWVLAYCIHELQAPWLGLILALAAGTFVGFLNGVLVARLGIPSIIATVATQFLWGGSPPCSLGGCRIRSTISKSCRCGSCSPTGSVRFQCKACGRSGLPSACGSC